ncbi:MAG: GNAT family N-acetyltransferase [Pseudomonadota bacterium]
MSNRRLRPATAADAPPLSALIHRVMDQSYVGHYSAAGIAHFKAVHTAEVIADRLQRGPVLLIQEAGVPIATGCLDGDRIFGMFVDPVRQGAGLGRAMITALESMAKARKLSKVVLYVSIPAYSFYERQGYVIGDEIVKDIGGGETVRFWDAEKHLT